MYALLIIIHIIVSVGLIVTVLLQAGKGGGLSGLAAEGGLQNAFGAEAGDVLKKATSVAAVIFMITSLSLAFISAHRGASVVADIKPERTPDTPEAQQSQKQGPVVKKKVVKVDPETGKTIEIEEQDVDESELGQKVKGVIEKFGDMTAPKEQPETDKGTQQTDEQPLTMDEDFSESLFETKPAQPVETTPTS